MIFHKQIGGTDAETGEIKQEPVDQSDRTHLPGPFTSTEVSENPIR